MDVMRFFQVAPAGMDRTFVMCLRPVGEHILTERAWQILEGQIKMWKLQYRGGVRGINIIFFQEDEINYYDI